MSFISRFSRLFQSPPPAQVDRPHQGGGGVDAEALYAKLAELKKASGAPERVGPADEWKSHAGFGRELVKLAMADGKVSDAEAKALADIADQRFNKLGNQEANDLPLLAYPEVNQIRILLESHSEGAQKWWAQIVERDGLVTLDDARALGNLLLADGKLTLNESEFKTDVIRAPHRFDNIRFSPDAVRFLAYLGLDDRALRSQKDDPRSNLSRHELAIAAEALALTAKKTGKS